MIKGPIYLGLFPASGSWSEPSPSPFLLAVNRHLAAAGEWGAGLEAASAISEVSSPVVTLLRGPRRLAPRGSEASLLLCPRRQPAPKPDLSLCLVSDLSFFRLPLPP